MLRAAETELPRLKQLGIGVVWLMPIHTIGVSRLGIEPWGYKVFVQ